MTDRPTPSAPDRPAPTARHPGTPPGGLPRTVVLVGLMGAGKSAIGRRLAAKLGLPFLDADAEIEAAAGCTIEEIFARDGEAGFRAGERKIIARLLTESPVHVLATGGGAFMDPQTRALIRERGLSVWLRADLDILLARTARRTNRPLLKKGDPREILSRLMEQRYPVYAEADLTVESDENPPEYTVERVLEALEAHVGHPLARAARHPGHHEEKH
ncbi:shikimate kinase [Azospirillum sp.]|uniref:shikimate kinase n=1 Tax=Azospirillum sp. TaxID=34012 RepID=UPI0039C8BAA7